MPLAPRSDVYGSTVGMMHSGPNQAGNKSLLAFRSDIGVPGYTGFNPGCTSIPLQPKGFEHTGKPVDSAFHAEATIATVAPEKTKISEYAQNYRKVPSDTKPFSKTGGGYWFGERKLTEGKPFVASTTYREEMLNGEEKAAKQMASTQGLSCTIAGYEVARQRAQTAQPVSQPTQRLSLTSRPMTSVTNSGDVVGYQTTYNAMVGPKTLRGAEDRLQATGTSTSGVQMEQRYQTMPRAMPPGMYGEAPTSRIDFGADGSDPMERSAPGERFQSRMTTTRDLSEGTTRNTNHLPGYTGHLPASKYHELARAQADGADERIDVKSDMLLYHLDQFTRTRLPGYTGSKPKAPKNITMTQPAQGPTTKTTYGDGCYQSTKFGVPHIDNTFYNNSRTGLMTFFHSAGEYVSDNGLTNAQSYFKSVRPGDGGFKMGSVSKTTYYGKPFHASNSLV